MLSGHRLNSDAVTSQDEPAAADVKGDDKEEVDLEDEDDEEDEAKHRKWTVLDPIKGPKMVDNLLKEPVLSAITRQSEFEYTG